MGRIVVLLTFLDFSTLKPQFDLSDDDIIFGDDNILDDISSDISNIVNVKAVEKTFTENSENSVNSIIDISGLVDIKLPEKDSERRKDYMLDSVVDISKFVDIKVPQKYSHQTIDTGDYDFETTPMTTPSSSTMKNPLTSSTRPSIDSIVNIKVPQFDFNHENKR